MQLAPPGAPAPAVQARVEGGKLSLGWNTMGVEIPLKPAKKGELIKNSHLRP